MGLQPTNGGDCGGGGRGSPVQAPRAPFESKQKKKEGKCP